MNSDNVEATPLKFRLNLSDEQVAALLALLEAEAVQVKPLAWDGKQKAMAAVPLERIKELFDV